MGDTPQYSMWMRWLQQTPAEELGRVFTAWPAEERTWRDTRSKELLEQAQSLKPEFEFVAHDLFLLSVLVRYGTQEEAEKLQKQIDYKLLPSGYQPIIHI